MADDATLTSGPSPYAPRAAKLDDVLGLMLAWSADEPQRIGEVALVPAGPVWVLGRYGVEGDAERLEFGRQRPGKWTSTGGFGSPTISRRQLTVRAHAGAILVANEGRLPIRRDGKVVDRTELRPGQVLELEDRVLLLCVRRPTRMEVSPGSEVRDFPFGEPDAGEMVGESPQIWGLRSHLSFVAGRNAHVLVIGPSGTGKELIARGIHNASSRAGRPLVSRNAATFPEALIDAELFGNIKDYPNPGMVERPGLVGEADGSSLFLDEIGELGHDMQAHLLRVLDDGEYQRLGESRRRKSSFRLIAATNRDESELKHDLLARLTMRVSLPDLNERREDIPLIARHLLRRIARRDIAIAQRFFDDGTPNGHPRIAPATMRALIGHTYQTHVRELEGLLWRAMGASTGNFLEGVETVTTAIGPYASEEWYGGDPALVPASAIRESMERHQDVQELVWRELGLTSRHVLARLLKRHGGTVRE